MNRTKIEWCDYTINPVKGLCPMACPYCYARLMYKRFKWNPEIRFEPEVYDNISVSPRGQKIFVGSTIELFGDWISQEWLNFIIKQCYVHPWHTFIFLTKQSQNLIKWSPFPDNCWVGITITDTLLPAVDYLKSIRAKKRFISFEPLLALTGFSLLSNQTLKNIDWVIIGQKTPTSEKTSPEMEWVKEIIEACDKVNIPVFLKNNLMNMFVYNQQSIMLPYWALNKTGEGGLRQELPCLNHQ